MICYVPHSLSMMEPPGHMTSDSSAITPRTVFLGLWAPTYHHHTSPLLWATTVTFAFCTLDSNCVDPCVSTMSFPEEEAQLSSQSTQYKRKIKCLPQRVAVTSGPEVSAALVLHTLLTISMCAPAREQSIKCETPTNPLCPISCTVMSSLSELICSCLFRFIL